MSNVINFSEYLQKRNAKRAANTPLPYEPDIDLTYQSIHALSEWFDSDEGEDFWCEETFIGHAINLCDAMIKMKDKSDDERLAEFLYHVRHLTDFIRHCVDDLPRHKALALMIAESFDPVVCAPIVYPSVVTNPVPEGGKESGSQKALRLAVLELIKAKRHSAKEMAMLLGAPERSVRGAITVLRIKGYKIVNYPADHTFGFEEGSAPPLGPVGGGDGRWKRWA